MTRINTNVESLIARRAIGTNNASLNQALLRLSTGLRINSGKDDPAGLIASEILRSSMRATAQAIDNTIRADTIIAVAEGGLQEISSLLLDIESLVDQSANEAGLTADEVAANQQQIDSILQTIDRLAGATAFGDKKLLNGNFDFTTSGVNVTESTGAVVDHLDNVVVKTAKIADGSFRQITVTRSTASEVARLSAVLMGTDGAAVLNGTLGDSTTLQITGLLGTHSLNFTSGATTAQMVTAINDRTLETGIAASAFNGATGNGPASLSLQSTAYGSAAFVSVTVLENEGSTASTSAIDLENTVGAVLNKDSGVDGSFTINGTAAIVKGLELSMRASDLSLDLTASTAFGSGTSAETQTSFEITGGGAVFSITPNVGFAGKAAIGIAEVSAAKLGNSVDGFLSTLGSGLANDLGSSTFTTSQRIVRAAIAQIASLRGRLGGFQKDTLATTRNALTVALENITAAESAIRDADFAVETSQLTRAQILVNSSTVVLQIANAQPQNVLALLG